MILKKIQLENIRSYEHAEIDFKEGSTILAGDIGTGKTTILLALEFALFGLQPGQKGAALLKNGKDEGSVLIEFEVDGKKIMLERGLKRGKTINQSYAIIEQDGEKEEISVTELKNRVLALLDYPKEFAKKTNLLYRFTVYTPQEEMKQIILEPSETRLDTLRHIFGIDKYKRIQENTALFTAKLRESIRNFEGQVKDFEEIKKKLEEKRTNIVSLDSALEKLKVEVQEKKDARLLAEESIKEVEEKIKEKENFEKEAEKTRILLFSKEDAFNESEKERIELLAQIEGIKKQLESSPDSEKLAELLNSLKSEIVSIAKLQLEKENELREIESKIKEKQKHEQEINAYKLELKMKKDYILDKEKEKEKLTVQIDDFKKLSFDSSEIDTVKNSISNTEKSLDEKNKLYMGLLSRINTIKSKINDLEKSKKDISKLVNCPTCFQSVPDDYKTNVLRKFDDDYLNAKKEIDILFKDRDSIIREIESLKVSILSLKKSLAEKERLKIKAEDISEKEKRIEELNRQKSDAENDVSLMTDKIEGLGKSVLLLKEYDSLYKEKNVAYKELLKNEREKEQEITNSQRELDRQANYKENIKEKENKITEIENKKAEISKNISILKSQLLQLSESVSLLKKFSLIFESRKKELEEARKKEKEKEIDLASVQKEKEFTLKLIDEINADISRKEMIKKKLVDLGELEDWLSSSFLNIIGFTEKNIMLKLREEFSKLFNEWFNILVPENFSVRLDEEFTPIIEQHGYQLDYAFMSGGERTAIALAYRLALNQVINSLMSRIKTKDLVVLDEPTDGFSEQQLDKMRDVLAELKVKQLIIVSHESKIESFVENIIKFKKENGLTRVEA